MKRPGSSNDFRSVESTGAIISSVLTNTAALSALQTLRSIAGQMGDTQKQVSSGLRVAAASDNAAYWSIATTMRSDNMAMSAVQDALGLGAAKVDTAYAGMDTVVDVISEFKSKLVAAMEDGVDKTKVQEELEQLKQQVVSVSKAASFSGQNWLRSDTATVPVAASVVTSFVRDATGNVSVKKADVPLNELTLFNSLGTGILQAGHVREAAPTPGSGGIGNIGGFLSPAYLSGYAPREGYTVSFPAPITFSAADVVEFDVLIDEGPTYAGDPYHVTITYNDINAALGRSDGTVADASQMSRVIYYVGTSQNVPITGGASGTNQPDGTVQWHSYYIDSRGKDNGIESSIAISNVQSTLAAGNTLGISTAPNTGISGYSTATRAFTGPFQLSETEGFQFEFSTQSNNPQTLTFSSDDVLAVLANSNGEISSASDFATLLNSKTAPLGVVVTATGSTISFDIDQAMYPEKGHKSRFYFSNIQIVDTSSPPVTPAPGGGSGGTAAGDFLSIDITTAYDKDEYLSRIETMLQDTISGAAALGSLRSRIQMQTEFASKLSDSIEQGIGKLVDADMNEASTRLKALQTQEQLATQALSIANNASENILSLFN